jgi:hypothetical protein
VSQILGIGYYEFKMHWRRRGLLVVTLAMLAIFLLPALAMRGEMSSRATLGQEGAATYTGSIVWFHWAVAAGLIFAVLPFLFADAIPRDRQLGVSELLGTLNLPHHNYLLGKIGGAVLGTLSSLYLAALISGLIWWFFTAPFNLSEYLSIWLVGAAVMTLINISEIVVLTSVMPNSRLAIMVCIGFVVLVPLIIGLTPRGDWLDAFSTLRPGIFYNYLNISWSGFARPLSMEWSVVLGLIQVIVLGAASLIWTRLRDQR